MIIYSFDVNLESDLINKLKIKYGIEDFPSVVINEGIPVVNPDNIDDLEPKLDVFAERDGGIPVIYLN